jgi:hypothetical protein
MYAPRKPAVPSRTACGLSRSAARCRRVAPSNPPQANRSDHRPCVPPSPHASIPTDLKPDLGSARSGNDNLGAPPFSITFQPMVRAYSCLVDHRAGLSRVLSGPWQGWSGSQSTLVRCFCLERIIPVSTSHGRPAARQATSGWNKREDPPGRRSSSDAAPGV